MPNVKTFIYDSQGKKDRIDAYLTAQLENFSRSRIQNLIKNNLVLVDEKSTKANHILSQGEMITVEIPEAKELTLTKSDLPLDVIYEDSDLLVINKPRGLVVHPAPGNKENTLVNILIAHCKDLSGINGVMRPGIVHRIDKDTSGLLLVAKNDKTHLSLAEQIKEHKVSRIYEAIVDGVIAEKGGHIDCPIGRHPVDRKKMAVTERNSKNAVTDYHVIQRFNNYTHVECKLETGRTHQIRVHMQYIGHPVTGDTVYGTGDKNPFGLKGQALHAHTITFMHPRTKEEMTFTAPRPPEFENVLIELKKSLENK